MPCAPQFCSIINDTQIFIHICLEDRMQEKLLRILLFLAAITGSTSSTAESDTVPLLTVIDALRENGFQVIYSSSLITEQQSVTVEEISIESLRKALAPLGLALQQIDGLWVIGEVTGKGFLVSGRLTSIDGNPIVNGYARALKSGNRAESDDKGYFELAGVSDDEIVVVGAPGFDEQDFPPSDVTAVAGQLGNIRLRQASLMENVIITGSLYRFPYLGAGSSAFNLSAEEIQISPSPGGDSMRIVNRLPGVSSVGVTAKPRIRGGLQDEVLILLDGVELLEPFHLSDYQAGYSSIDHRTVDSIDIYTGGFPVRYGNRMSGVIDVKTNREELPFNTEIGWSNLSAFINSRGQGDGDKQLGWLISARRGDLEELTQFIDSLATDPRFSDATASVNFMLNDAMELTLGGLVTKDNISFSDDEERASSRIDNNYLWSRLNIRHSKKLQSSLVFSYAGIDREKLQNSFEEEGKGGFVNYNQDVRQLSMRNDYSYAFGRHFLEFGFQAAYGKSEYDYQAEYDRGDLAELLDNEQEVSADVELEPSGWFGGAYLAAEFAYKKLLVQPSIRWDWQDYYFTDQDYQVSPRLGLAYELSNDVALRLSVGRFYQPEGLHELQALDGEQRFFEPQSSDQLVLGVDWQRDRLSFKGELYYKRYRNLKTRYENFFNPFVLLPEMEPDRIRLTPEKGMAKGADLEIKYDFTPAVRGVIRYSHMNVDDRIDGTWVPRRWSQRDTVNAQISWQRDSFTLAAAVNWHTGWRTSVLQSSIPEGTQIPAESVLNNAELREYLSLDISASKSWRLGKTLITLHADITNVTERNNLAGIDFDVEQEDGQIIFTPDNETLLPLIPSIGIIVSF